MMLLFFVDSLGRQDVNVILFVLNKVSRSEYDVQLRFVVQASSRLKN